MSYANLALASFIIEILQINNVGKENVHQGKLREFFLKTFLNASMSLTV